MRSITRKLTGALLIFALLIALTVPAAAKTEYTPPTVTELNVNRYSAIPIAYGGKNLSLPGRLISGVTYISLRAITEAVGGKMTYRSATRTATVTFSGMTFSVTDKSHLIEANGRALYTADPAVILSDGRMYLPVRIGAKIFSLGVTWNDRSRSVALSGTARPLTAGSVYYDADVLYWLSRIISAEAQGEPFEGQMAVGSVILNRVRSADFPNTVWGVIFDKKNGVQFTPTANGTVYRTPTASAVLAARAVMEGYSVSDRALFFMEPRISTSRWIEQNRTYLFTVGHHDFYA